jgi:hypothetical protein
LARVSDIPLALSLENGEHRTPTLGKYSVDGENDEGEKGSGPNQDPHKVPKQEP